MKYKDIPTATYFYRAGNKYMKCRNGAVRIHDYTVVGFSDDDLVSVMKEFADLTPGAIFYRASGSAPMVKVSDRDACYRNDLVQIAPAEEVIGE